MIAMLGLIARDWAAIGAVVFGVLVLAWVWWVWPDARLRVPRMRRAPLEPTPEYLDDNWQLPPYDWGSRPAARVDLGLRSPDFRT